MKRNLIYHTHISASTSVHARSQSGVEHRCQLDAIGRDGMVLTCDRQTLDALLPNSMSIAPKQPASLETRFQLETQHEEIATSCEVIYARRVSREKFLLELRFKDMDEQQFEEVDQFVGSAIQRGNRPLDMGFKHVA